MPGGGVWNGAESVGLDFALFAALPGMMGFSGDLAGLTPAQRGRVAETIIFFKRWRRFIAGAAGHLLTPPMPFESREGWIVFQLQSPDDDTSLVFVYRLGNAGCPPVLRPRELDSKRRYTLQWGLGEPAKGPAVDGASLLRDGLPLPPDRRY